MKIIYGPLKRTCLAMPVLCVLVFLPIYSTFVFGADCYLDVTADIKKEFIYRDRGGYCEGLYEQGYSNRADIKLVGYHLFPFDFIPGVDPFAHIGVSAPKHKKVHTVILDNVQSKFYRRDQNVVAGERVTWPLDIINSSKVSLEANQLVGIACLPLCFEATDIYYPIYISSSSQVDSISPSLYLELPLNIQKVRLVAVDRVTKKPLIDLGTKQPLYQYVRSFEFKTVSLVEVFFVPHFEDDVYLEVDVLLKSNAKKEKIISRSFLLGGSIGHR